MDKEDIGTEISKTRENNIGILNRIKENFKQFVNNIELIAKKVLVFTSIFGVLYFIVNLISNYMYQSDCENYYKIPAKYFSKTIDLDLVFIGFAVLLSVISFIPVLIQQYSIECKTNTNGNLAYMIFLEIIIGMTCGAMNICYFISIFNNSTIPDWLKNIYVIIIFSQNEWVATLITIFLYVSCLVLLLLEPKFKKIRSRFVKKFLYSFLIILILYNLSIVIMGIFSKVASPIMDKTSYEIISIQNEKYAVLSEYDNKYLCVKYQMKKEQGQERFTLYTDSYNFFSPEEGIYSYIHMEVPPTIEKERNSNN